MSKSFSQCLENKEHNFSLGRWLGHRLESTKCPSDVVGRAFGLRERMKCSARGKEMQTGIFFSENSSQCSSPPLLYLYLIKRSALLCQNLSPLPIL